MTKILILMIQLYSNPCIKYTESLPSNTNTQSEPSSPHHQHQHHLVWHIPDYIFTPSEGSVPCSVTHLIVVTCDGQSVSWDSCRRARVSSGGRRVRWHVEGPQAEDGLGESQLPEVFPHAWPSALCCKLRVITDRSDRQSHSSSAASHTSIFHTYFGKEDGEAICREHIWKSSNSIHICAKENPKYPWSVQGCPPLICNPIKRTERMVTFNQRFL